jgi:hypothetical protein
MKPVGKLNNTIARTFFRINYKSDLTASAFKVLANLSGTEDVAGPTTTLLIYSTDMPIQDAFAKLEPIIASLPYPLDIG